MSNLHYDQLIVSRKRGREREGQEEKGWEKNKGRT